MTPNCSGWEERLNAAHDGELGAADRAALDAHLAGCPDCRRTLEGLQALDRDLGLLRTDSTPLEERIIAAVRTEPRARRLWLPALAAAAVLIVAFATLRPRPAPPPPVASLHLATGPVELWGGRDWTPIPPGTLLKAGDAVRTGDGSKCELLVSDGSVVRLNHSTEVVLHQERQLELRQGEVFARVSIRPTPLTFTTEASSVEAAEGCFNLSVDLLPVPKTKTRQSSTLLTVLDGSARVAGTPEVAAGALCRMTPGEKPVPGFADPYLQTRWIHDLLRLKPGQDAETDRRVIGLLARINRSKSGDLYEREIRALGERSLPGLFTVVRSLPPDLKEYDRRAAAKLLTDLAGPTNLPLLIALTGDPDADINGWAHKGLTRLTGENLKGLDAWSRWLRDHHAAWSCQPVPPGMK